MRIDIITIALTVLVNALLMIGALGYCVGFRSKDGLRSWTLSLLCQAMGFACLIAAGFVWPRLFASLGVSFLSLSVVLLQVATARYTRPMQHTQRWFSVPVLLGSIHWLIFENVQWTVGLTNLVIGIQSLWAAHQLLGGTDTPKWRWLVGATTLMNACLILGRAVLVLFDFAHYPTFVEPHPLNIAGMLMLGASMVIGTVGFLLAHREVSELTLQRLASYDGLTGLFNRRVWLEQSQTLFDDPRRKAQDIVMLIDLDHFKKVNDTYGHATGDRVLSLLGKVLREVLRRGDIAGRFGGEEFCVVLVDCSPEAFSELNVKLHAALCVQSSTELGFTVTFSAGAVVRTTDQTLTELTHAADIAMYHAKKLGRNQTHFVPHG